MWVALALAPAIWGQTSAASFFNPLSPEGGIHLTGVSVYSGYYSSGGGGGGFQTAVQNPFLTGPSAVAGIAATFGGSKATEKSTFTWSYSPSYFNAFYGNDQISNNGSVSQMASLNWVRKFGTKWSFATSISAAMVNLQQLYFNPTTLSSIATTATTFQDLAAGILTGKSTDPQLAALLTGAPLPTSPQQGYLYGDRMLTVSSNIALSWAVSGRTSVAVTVAGNRAQALSSGALGGTSAAPADFVAPQMTAATASVSWSYSLSPRTRISAQASSSRTFSRLEQGYTTNTSVSIGRTMSQRWFVQATAGAGKLLYSRQTYTAPGGVQYLYGASIGFKTQTQTFLVSYNKSLGDAYGLGSGSTSAATGAWSWRRPGSTWSVSAGGGYQELNNHTFSNTRGWVANAGVAKKLSPHFFLSAQYMYFRLPQNINAVALESSENGVSVGMTWSPSPYR